MSTLTTAVDREIGQLLANTVRSGSSGLVTAERGKLKRIFCLEEGRLIWAVSNLIEEQLSEILIKSGIVDPGSVMGAIDAARKTGTSLSRLVLEHHVLSEELLRETIEGHLRQMLTDTLDWPDGQAGFAAGRPDVGDEYTVRLNPVALLLGFAEKVSQVDRLRIRLGLSSTMPRLDETRQSLLEGVKISPAVQAVLTSCNGRQSLNRLVESCSVPADDARRAAYGLLLTGVLHLGSDQPQTDGEVTRDELNSLLMRSEGVDHYSILALSPHCTLTQVRDAYYGVARRYHPDRLRSTDLDDMVKQIEEYFGRVTEAYNTLYDPESRKEYDEWRESAQVQLRAEQDTGFLAKENYRRAMTLIERGRYNDAVTSLENALQLDTSNADYYLALGRLLARNPRHRQRAETLLVECNRLDPGKIEGYLALGELYLKRNRKADAERLFREALSWEPGHLEATARLKELGVKV